MTFCDFLARFDRPASSSLFDGLSTAYEHLHRPMDHPLANALETHAIPEPLSRTPSVRAMTADIGERRSAPNAPSPEHGEAGVGAGVKSGEWEMQRWLPVLGMFFIMICTVGLQYTFGIMLVAFTSALPSSSLSTLVSVGSGQRSYSRIHNLIRSLKGNLRALTCVTGLQYQWA